MWLLIKNFAFTILVPGTVAVFVYRYSRNPMYVGVLCVIFGWAALYQSTAIAVYGVCVWTGFQLFVLLYEEPHLRKVFGDAYTRYCSSVGRWLTIPPKRFN